MSDIEKMGNVQCCMCGGEVVVKKSKKDKPYYSCDCGVQMFCRQKKAIDCMMALMTTENAANDEGKAGLDAPKEEKKPRWYE